MQTYSNQMHNGFEADCCSIKVSIITPSFNQGLFIEETINSVLNQTYKNIEYIIVDGGSTDNTMDIVEKYKDKIDVVIHEKDKEQSDAINKGFKLAKGELIGWINSDDILYSNCIETIVGLYKLNPNAAIYYGSKIDFLTKDGVIYHTKCIEIKSRKYLLEVNYDLIQQGSFYKSDILKKVHYLDESIYYCMDLDLWLNLLNYGGLCHYSKEPLAGFRRWEDAKTSTGGVKFLWDIYSVLLKHNSRKLTKNNLRLLYFFIKCKIKGLFC